MPVPLTLSAPELDAIFRLAAPVAAHERDLYLINLGAALAVYPVVGLGLVSRVAGELQGSFSVEARIKASDSSVARHFSPKKRPTEAEA